MTELIGKIIYNRYRVEAFLGRGGMAEVYKVWDSQKAVYLAIKVLREDLAQDKIFLRRFQREAQTLSHLEHPYIVRFYGLERDGDLTFMVMDYIEGTTLRKMIFDSDVALPHEKILNVIRSICSALHYAHQVGMVHCDIKPGNIMIDQHGKVLLSDFGIARMSDAATATMVGLGTPAYMAPEQARGLDPSPQTDIYALGIVLYEMLTGGERPFTGEQSKTTGSTSEKVRWEQINLLPPSPKSWNPDISDELEAVVLKCVAKDQIERYQTALDLFNALEMAISEGDEVHLDAPDEIEKDSIVDDLIVKNACPNCQRDIQPEWQLCPTCGASLDIVKQDSLDTADRLDADESNRRKFPKGCLVFVFVISLLVIVFTAAFFYLGFHRTNQAAHIAPEDTVSMITFSPGPIQLIQLLQIQNLVDAAPVFMAVPGMFEWAVTMSEEFASHIQIDPVDDVLPWIGREASLVFLPQNYGTTERNDYYDSWPFILTIASRNVEASGEIIDDIVRQLEAQDYVFSSSFYQGYEVTEVNTDGVLPIAMTNLEHSVLITSDAAVMQASIDRHLGDQSDTLFEGSAYNRFLKKLPLLRLGYIYLNWPVVVESYRLEQTDFPYADQLLLGDNAGLAVKLNSEGVNFDFLLEYKRDQLTPIAIDEMSVSYSSDYLLGYSPENTLMFFSGKKISPTWDLLTRGSFLNGRVDLWEVAVDELDWEGAEIKNVDDFVEYIDANTDIHLVNDLLDYNSEEYALMIVSDLDGLYGDEDLPFGLLIAARMDDPEIGFENFQNFIEKAYQYLDVNHFREKIDDINVWYVENETRGVILGYTYWGDVLLIGTSKNVLKDVLGESSQHLSDSAFYQSATQGLPPNKNKMVYLNLENTIFYSREAMGDFVPSDLNEYIDPIKAISIATEPLSQDGWLHGNIFIYTR